MIPIMVYHIITVIGGFRLPVSIPSRSHVPGSPSPSLLVTSIYPPGGTETVVRPRSVVATRGLSGGGETQDRVNGNRDNSVPMVSSQNIILIPSDPDIYTPKFTTVRPKTSSWYLM